MKPIKANIFDFGNLTYKLKIGIVWTIVERNAVNPIESL